MASRWSAENATKAYLRAMKMSKRAKEPDVAEFISALAAGNNAQLMVIAVAGVADSKVLALVAAAHQTGGQVICILNGDKELQPSIQALGDDAERVKFVAGDAETLLRERFSEADCIVIDCNISNCERILETAANLDVDGRDDSSLSRIVLGFNALCNMGCWRVKGVNAQLLPIGEGILVSRVGGGNNERERSSKFSQGQGRKNQYSWVVKIDKWTGEEHVFRVRDSTGKAIAA